MILNFLFTMIIYRDTSYIKNLRNSLLFPFWWAAYANSCRFTYHYLCTVVSYFLPSLLSCVITGVCSIASIVTAGLITTLSFEDNLNILHHLSYLFGNVFNAVSHQPTTFDSPFDKYSNTLRTSSPHRKISTDIDVTYRNIPLLVISLVVRNLNTIKIWMQ